MKLVKERPRREPRRNFFSQRVVIPWNALQEKVVSSKTTLQFNIEYDKCILKLVILSNGILGVSRRDHMRNEEIRRILHVSPIDEVMRGGRLRWFGHVQRRDANNVTRRVMELAIPGRPTRRRGRPKKTWHQHIKDGMAGVGVNQDLVLDRQEWRRRTRPTLTR